MQSKDQVAVDGEDGKNSPASLVFAAALLLLLLLLLSSAAASSHDLDPSRVSLPLTAPFVSVSFP